MERGRKGLLAVSIILPESGLAVTGTLLGLLHGDSTRVLAWSPLGTLITREAGTGRGIRKSCLVFSKYHHWCKHGLQYTTPTSSLLPSLAWEYPGHRLFFVHLLTCCFMPGWNTDIQKMSKFHTAKIKHRFSFV